MPISKNPPKNPEFITLDEPLDYLGWSSRNWTLIKARKPDIYELKIALIDTKPTIYRTILIPGDVTLNKLHLVIQNSFNWWNYHLFRFDGYGKTKTVEDVFENQSELMYEYDFGTTQYHLIKEIAFYEFTDKDQHKVFPVCVEAKRFAPFEDSSDWNYMLEIAQDKKHEEYKETIDWLEEMWDQTTEGEQGKFSVSKLLDNKVGLLEINVELSRLQLYPTKEYKEFDIPTSMKNLK
jgi:hypothetical protein